MAAPGRNLDPDVDSAAEALRGDLEREPFRYEFFQAARLLQRLSRGRRAPVGGFDHPATEAVRFGAHASSSFPASEIQTLLPQPDGPPKMIVNFMGLTGPSGVLPAPFDELVQERERAGETAFGDFLDIFNHRVISMFYRAWEKYRLPIARERGGRDHFSERFRDLIGIGTPGLENRFENRQGVLDDSLIYYAGLLSLGPRSAAGLRQIVSDYFDVPVEIEQFVGRWRKLDPDAQCIFEYGDSETEQLGIGTVIGDEVWDRQSAARIQLGPLDLAKYREFLPGGSAHEPLRALTRFYCGDRIEFEAQLILKRDDVPRCEMGLENDAPRLGWVSWIKGESFDRDPGDTILNL
ncbi:MAG: type VI secretion system baseplate subunit TssG [Acidobacteriota bacterium]|nr:type VI secretion system baseplate subunit TssG [Acidobacteriota bacterium]